MISRSLLLAALLSFSAFAGEMVLIPAGKFIMGNPKGAADEKGTKEVVISAFYMDKTEVTQIEYAALTGQNPSRFRGDKKPVERIRWTDAALYCNLRSKREGLKPCYNTETWECDFTANGYRLPTEAEWEYACRAKSTGIYFFKGKQPQIPAYAWIRKNSSDQTHDVATRKANAFGLFDMYGNVAEWCNDWYAPVLQGGKNPKGPKTGTKRVLRGGSWQSRDKNISSSKREADDPNTADICQGYDTYGFRCVRKK